MRALTLLASFGCLIGLLAITIACRKPTQPNNTPSLSGNLIKNPGLGTEELLPELAFETKAHDFGKVIEGEKVSFDFHFKNVGRAPLIISDVQSSCGCTVPEWPRGIVKVGEGGYIRVVFDSKGQKGEFSKHVVITANTYPNKTILKITGIVYNK